MPKKTKSMAIEEFALILSEILGNRCNVDVMVAENYRSVTTKRLLFTAHGKRSNGVAVLVPSSHHDSAILRCNPVVLFESFGMKFEADLHDRKKGTLTVRSGRRTHKFAVQALREKDKTFSHIKNPWTIHATRINNTKEKA